MEVAQPFMVECLFLSTDYSIKNKCCPRRYEMSRKRTTNRAIFLFTILMLATLLLSAAAPQVHADGTWT